MKRWPMFLVYFLEIAVMLTAIYYEPTFSVRGTIWREAFYDGKPTSWWRAELDLWDVTITPAPPPLPQWWYMSRKEVSRASFEYSRRQTNWENLQERWLPRSHEKEVERALLRFFADLDGPPILRSSDIDAKSVLTQLLNDPSPKIRQLARIGLKMDPAKEE
jgi:hypothetical protein